MKVWVTKYVLSKGILEFEADRKNDYVVVDTGQGFSAYFSVGKNCHLDYESARVRALEMIDKKRASIEKQMIKLAKLRDELK
jgi:hypothetical protein